MKLPESLMFDHLNIQFTEIFTGIEFPQDLRSAYVRPSHKLTCLQTVDNMFFHLPLSHILPDEISSFIAYDFLYVIHYLS